MPDPKLGTTKNADGTTTVVEQNTTFDSDGRKVTTKDSKDRIVEVEYTGRLMGHSLRDVYERTTYDFGLDYADIGLKMVVKETYDKTETDNPDMVHQTITEVYGSGKEISKIDFTFENGVMSGRKQVVTDPATGKSMTIEEKYSLPPAEMKVTEARFNGEKIDPKTASDKKEEISRLSGRITTEIFDAVKKAKEKKNAEPKRAEKETPKPLPNSKADRIPVVQPGGGNGKVNLCLIGTWHSQSQATFYDREQAAMRMNGAGLTFIVEPNGMATFDYSTVKPLFTERHYGNDVVKVTTIVTGKATAQLDDPYNYVIAPRKKTLKSTVTFTENYSDGSAPWVFTAAQQYFLPFESEGAVSYKCNQDTLILEFGDSATLTFLRVK